MPIHFVRSGNREGSPAAPLRHLVVSAEFLAQLTVINPTHVGENRPAIIAVHREHSAEVGDHNDGI
ncbi:MAG: hypothetical protein H0U76_02455 [Ktedonobacteraceae bacterium]|nr:hypothetical protein [Ktedonobacteraceae bacterium]